MREQTRSPTTQTISNRWLAITIGLLATGVYVLHFPGQATYDTLAQAYDGATKVYTSNQPPAMSLLLSTLTLPGVLALQIALFSGAVWRLLALLNGSVLAKSGAVIFLFLFPVLLIYVGIVWKDVVFAHGAVLAVLLLPAHSPHKHWRLLCFCAALLAAAVAVRQQAAIVAMLALVYLICAGGIAGLKDKVRWIAVSLFIATFGLCSLGIKTVLNSSADTGGALEYQGPIRQIAMFDLGGILKRVPELTFPAIAASAIDIPLEHRPTRERVVALLHRYSPERQDFMVEPETQPQTWVPTAAWLTDWRANVQLHPSAYVSHRFDATAWLLGFHDPQKCLPFSLGIPSEPRHMLAALGVEPGLTGRAQALLNLGVANLTLFRPWIYIGLSLITTAYLLASGARKHSPIILLQISGLLYAASYFVIGFACDFRYTYFSTLSALFGVVYAVVVITSSRRNKDREELAQDALLL